MNGPRAEPSCYLYLALSMDGGLPGWALWVFCKRFFLHLLLWYGLLLN